MVSFVSTAAGLNTALIVYGPPATVSPAVRPYVARTASVARKPLSVPVNAGSVAPYVLLAAAGVTDAVALLIVNAAVLYVSEWLLSNAAGLNTALTVYGPPATVSPAVRLQVAVTASLASKPPSVPVN